MQKGLAKMKRTNYCGELSVSNVENKVVLMGWAAKNRDLGGVLFIDLRDRTGVVQLVINEQAGGEVKLEARERAISAGRPRAG